MKIRAPAPRLLPTTILALAALLAVKSVDLVRAATASENERSAATAPAEPRTDAAPSRPAAEARPNPPAAPPVLPLATPRAEPPPISESERAVLLELRERRTALDAREAALETRESVMQAAEHTLDARVAEMKALQEKLEALDAARKAQAEANWHGLVKVYESMKPREAAAIFNDLDMPVLLQVVDRMKEAKAAAVLGAMQPDKARELTAGLARMRAAAADPEAAPHGG